MFLGGLPSSVSGKTDDGTCSSTLSKKCIASLVAFVNSSSSAMSLLSSKSQSKEPDRPCSVSGFSSDCEKEFGIRHWHSFLAPNFTTPVEAHDNCTRVNPGDSDAMNRAFTGLQYDIEPLPFDNFTYYDEALRTPQPVLTTYWLKGGSESHNSAGNHGEGWADTKLFCINTNNTEPGSRTLDDAKKALAPGSMRVQLLVLVGLNIAWQAIL